MKDISFPLAFLAGILSFLSPCVLPLIPSYVSFITGISFKDLTVGTDRKRIRYLTITHSLIFISGFSSVFIVLGISSSAIGRLLFDYQDFLRIIGGILVIILGLFVANFLNFDFLMREKRFHISGRPAGYIGSFLVGMAFAAGWSPCIGPILGTILLYSGSKASAIYGFWLLLIYSLGFAIPFFLSAIAINSFLIYSTRLAKHLRWIMVLSGIILIIFGIMLLSNKVRQLSLLLLDFGIKF
ncbi:MAG: cytochrome c biogenesis protein CcdA [Nitrospira sp.]|nr:cytochrome c biogenesis protein CcdA [Nitrospira sp.]